MINREKFESILKQYKQDFLGKWWENEKFKWESITFFKKTPLKQYETTWDINAPDFAKMLKKSLSTTASLLSSRGSFPKTSIIYFAQKEPETVRTMFKDLYNEKKDIIQRIKKFELQSKVLLKKYNNNGKWKSHFQDANTITTYLWLKYPDKYPIYKFRDCLKMAKELGSNYIFKIGNPYNNILTCFKMLEEIRKLLKHDKEIARILKTKINEEKEGNYYPDENLATLAMDFGFYIYRKINTKQNYWWVNANPAIWKFSDLKIGKSQYYTFYTEKGNKRHIFQNFLDIKKGDFIIGYETSPFNKIVALAKISKVVKGEKIYIKKTKEINDSPDFNTLIKYPELKNAECFKSIRGSLFKLTKKEYDFIRSLLNTGSKESGLKNNKYSEKNFLEEVYIKPESLKNLMAILENKRNLILQGAPGTGKTFAAKRLAYTILGEKENSHIELVQFHQSYSYEDFIMGYKPTEDGFKLKQGVFYKFCKKAEKEPNKKFYFIIDEINRGNLSKIFGELLMLIEKDYRTEKIALAYNDIPFSVPSNLYIIGMMNTADRSLAMIDYALRRRFGFFDMIPAFESEGFKKYQKSLGSSKLNFLIEKIKALNTEIENDASLGKGFRIGHSYFCGKKICTDDWLSEIVEYDILPTLNEYWFDDEKKFNKWQSELRGVF